MISKCRHVADDSPVDSVSAGAFSLKLLRVDSFCRIAICLFLSLSILVVYWQVTGFDFVNLDDQRYIKENHIVRQGITPDGIKWAFSTVYASNWHPATWISHMLDIELFGFDPGMHHLVNVIFHILNTILLFLALSMMTGALWKSAIVAGLFALHPLHVESVAWISERKDVLSTFFWMLTIICYVWYTRHCSVRRYLLVMLFFVLGLLSKPMVVTLPFVLLLLDFWPLGRIEGFSGGSRSRERGAGSRAPTNRPAPFILIAEKIPVLILSVFVSGMTVYAQTAGGALGSPARLHIDTRITNAIHSYATYLEKMIWPMDLAVFYPYPGSVHSTIILLSAFLLVSLTVLAVFLWKSLPYLAVGWFWYLGTLVPAIGIVQVGSQSMADRYTYIPLIGIFLILVWGAADLIGRWRQGRVALGAIAAAVFVLLMWAAWVQVGFWRNSETLFRHTVEVTANNCMAHYLLGLAICDRGDVDGAIRQYRQCLKIDSRFFPAYLGLGQAYAKKKEAETASRYYEKGLQINPDNPYTLNAHIRFGQLLLETGNINGAVEHFRKALRINPNNYEAHANLGNIMLLRGYLDDAIRHYLFILRLSPDQAGPWYNLGNAYSNKGEMGKAIAYYEEAVRRNPGFEKAVESLSYARNARPEVEGSITRLRHLIRTRPGDPRPYAMLGDLYKRLGNYGEAAALYQKALLIRPEYTRAMNGLAFSYNAQQEFRRAIDVLLKMRQLTPDNPDISYNIACLYAKQGMVSESVEWLEQSVSRGFNKWDLIRKDPDLENVRKTAYVRELMKNH